MVNLEVLFPRLLPGTYRVTSPPDPDYNCIAWAVGNSDNWWWPGSDVEREYWPPGVPRQVVLGAFQAMFATFDYVVCPGEHGEPGFEKIALFTNTQGKPTHAARQLPEGRWTIKLGKKEDIEHGLHDLEGSLYGAVALIMRRPSKPEQGGVSQAT
jgi:hypothetical protein